MKRAALCFLMACASCASADELTVFRNGVTYQWNGVVAIVNGDPWGDTGTVSMLYATSVADGIFADAFALAPPSSPWLVSIGDGPTITFSINGYCQGESSYDDAHGGLAVYAFCAVNNGETP